MGSLINSRINRRKQDQRSRTFIAMNHDTLYTRGHCSVLYLFLVSVKHKSRTFQEKVAPV